MFNMYDFNNRTINRVCRLISLLLDEDIYMCFYEKDRLTKKIDDLIVYLEKLKKES